MQRLTQKTTGFAHADWRETRKNDKVSVGYEVDIRRLGVMDKITIAIADDQEMTVEMLSNIVASQDDFVLAGTAGNGEEALDLVRRCKPQILLLDMIMPLVDGKEVMRQLQSDETISPDTKVIVVTAADRRALAEEMFALGALYYIIKPFDSETIIQSIRAALGRELILESSENAGTKENTPGKPLEHRITELMLLLGVPAHLRGYQYLREAVFMVATRPDTRHQMAKIVYGQIAKKHDVSNYTVERAIRHAIEIAWSRGDMDTMDRIFGYTVQASKGRPTNTEYIAAVADYLILATT